MREILFRGKSKLNGKWHQGSFVKHTIFEDWDYIMKLNDTLFDMEQIRVISNSIGQYTGLKDKNGVKIFEGDIVKDNAGRLWEVCYRVSAYVFAYLKDKKQYQPYTRFNKRQRPLEAVGNIYDNPKLVNNNHD